MNLDEIVQYINEESVRGDLAREFQGIISDYQAGSITAEEKTELVNAVVEGFKAADTTGDEEVMRWVVNAANIVAAVV